MKRLNGIFYKYNRDLITVSRQQHSHHNNFTLTHRGRDVYMSVCECKCAYQKFLLASVKYSWQMPECFSTGRDCTSRSLCLSVYQPRPCLSDGLLSIADLMVHELWEVPHWGRCWHSPLWPRRAQRGSLRTPLCRVTRWLALVII